MAEPRTARPTDDLIQPFQIETMAAQGRLVRLGAAVDSVLSAHDYPVPVAEILGEAQAIAVALAGALKFDGVLSLQIKGEGPVTLLVADVTSEGGLRGYAQYRATELERMLAGEDGPRPSEPVPRLFGNGHLAFTVDQGPDTNRYQGIVALEGATLADCAHAYLRRSVQLDAAIKVAVGRITGADGETSWRAGALMVQRMAEGGVQRSSGEADPDREDAWRRAVVLMGSSTSAELLDPDLHPHRLLYRLFHEDGVRVFTPTPLAMRCRCSRARVVQVLKSFPRAEIESMKVDGRIHVTCEFCNTGYDFDDAAMDAIWDGSDSDAQQD